MLLIVQSSPVPSYIPISHAQRSSPMPISEYPQHTVFHQCDRTSFTPIQNNRHHTHTPFLQYHHQLFFPQFTYSRQSPIPYFPTYRFISSDSISSAHASIMSIIFSRKHCKYVNSRSLIFTVLTSHVTCGQPRFPCHCWFLPEAAGVWRNSTNISLILAKYFRQYLKGSTVVGIPWNINVILPTASEFFFFCDDVNRDSVLQW